MKWSILILTQPSRVEFLERLMSYLGPQLLDFNDIELVITLFDKQFSIGENRANMIEAAKGEYVNFVDDDDLIAEDYVNSIYPLLDGEVDYIGFEAKFFDDGIYTKPSFHSLVHKNWFENQNGYYRDLSHLNPIRKPLAVAGNMGMHKEPGQEDWWWAGRLRDMGIVKTEKYIPRPMYFAYYRRNKPDSPF